MYHLIALLKHPELEDLRRISREGVVINPEWLEWSKAWNIAEQQVRGARAQLLTREPAAALRRVVGDLSSVHERVNLEAHADRVDRLIVAVGAITGLFL